MGDGTKRPLHIPPWQIPYLETHRIYELFHELARELVINQPNDHLLFLKQILLNASRAIHTARVILLNTPKINCVDVAKSVAGFTKQKVVTEDALMACYQMKQDPIQLFPTQKAKSIAHLVRNDNAYTLGWILVGCINNANDAKALLQEGILPTHVIHLIPPYQNPLKELIYCNVPSYWPDYRREIMGVRDTFKTVLKEVHIQTKTLEEVVEECTELIKIQPSKNAIKPRVLIIGPRGSGRFTQAKLLVNSLNLIHVDFRRLLCKVWRSPTDLGQRLRDCQEEACFHSDLLAEILHQRILEEDCLENGWVLTGFPFNKNDFEYIDCLHTPPNRVIFLEGDMKLCKERIIQRKTNMYTGALVNLQTSPEEKHNKNLGTHPKDNPDIVDAELAYYCENYGQLRKYCGPTANYINADQCERWVHETILAIIIRQGPSGVRVPFQAMSDATSSISTDSCICTPVPSEVMNCYVQND